MSVEWKVFGMAGGLASLMGLAHRIRHGEKITALEIARVMFLGLMAGLIVAMITFRMLMSNPDNFYYWLAISGLAGYGAQGLLDVLASALQRRAGSLLNQQNRSQEDEK